MIKCLQFQVFLKFISSNFEIDKGRLETVLFLNFVCNFCLLILNHFAQNILLICKLINLCHLVVNFNRKRSHLRFLVTSCLVVIILHLMLSLFVLKYLFFVLLDHFNKLLWMILLGLGVVLWKSDVHRLDLLNLCILTLDLVWKFMFDLF